MTKLEKNNILKTNLHMEKVTSNKPLIFFSYAIKKTVHTSNSNNQEDRTFLHISRILSGTNYIKEKTEHVEIQQNSFRPRTWNINRARRGHLSHHIKGRMMNSNRFRRHHEKQKRNRSR